MLTLPKQQLWAIEVKRSSAPKVEKGFYFACEDLKPRRRFVVYPGKERFSLGDNIEAVGLSDLARELSEAK